jgi:hypothetical protein
MRARGIGNRFYAVGLALVAGCVATAADGAMQTGRGKYWLQVCTGDYPGRSKEDNIALCSEAGADVDILNALGPGPRRAAAHPYCRPRDVTAAQQMTVVVKYLQDNPAELTMRFDELVVRALQKAFPCPGNSN